MKVTYKTPAGAIHKVYDTMAHDIHLLIAGCSGSGKSCVINGIMSTLLYSSPHKVRFILIDPKKVELSDYAGLPHTIQYADSADMVDALHNACDIMMQRYDAMKAQGVKMYPGADIYVIIDEFAQLVLKHKDASEYIQQLAQLGRAAKIHVIAATQCPTAAVISTPIKVNFDSRIALHVRSRQDSRNIMDISGAESLPEHGKAYYVTAGGYKIINLPYVQEPEYKRLIDHWMDDRNTIVH